ncbi:hypothetical protein JCM19233_3559 [Vibrio astriarenae]|nr:hypothetical protein JCM19233_3559 [Vibrio sp. C7]
MDNREIAADIIKAVTLGVGLSKLEDINEWGSLYRPMMHLLEVSEDEANTFILGVAMAQASMQEAEQLLDDLVYPVSQWIPNNDQGHDESCGVCPPNLKFKPLDEIDLNEVFSVQ